uniref:Uncharacterized protein n=1 Tax=Vitrella brassicaformis TaxID=1169539 RepID=A0A7S1JRW1_9ALVE|mmetsp:Transcript_21830/g.53506  ORF Transcript_21830/g.53506 Transcript_21830/m.53506 type:complete len:101 (+) Transcript_21830:480-782(+)
MYVCMYVCMYMDGWMDVPIHPSPACVPSPSLLSSLSHHPSPPCWPHSGLTRVVSCHDGILKDRETDIQRAKLFFLFGLCGVSRIGHHADPMTEFNHQQQD